MITVLTACDLNLSQDEEGLIRPLSPCCKSPAGLWGPEMLLVCSACYGDLEGDYLSAVDTHADLADLLRNFSCPIPESCATHTFWQFERHIAS